MNCQHKGIKNQLTEPKLRYIAWLDWADKQIEIGNEQVLCTDCNRYVWQNSRYTKTLGKE